VTQNSVYWSLCRFSFSFFLFLLHFLPYSTIRYASEILLLFVFILARLQYPNNVIIMINVKRELDADDDCSSDDKRDSELHAVCDDADYQTPKRRRGIRSRYLAFKNMIHGNFVLLALLDSYTSFRSKIDFEYSLLTTT